MHSDISAGSMDKAADVPTEDLKSRKFARQNWIPRRDNGDPVRPQTVRRRHKKGIGPNRAKLKT